MKATHQEIIDALLNTYIREGLAKRIIEHGIEPPDGMCIVPIYDCTMCGNTGTISRNHTTTLTTHCPCNGFPQSRYNVNKAMLEVKDKP